MARGNDSQDSQDKDKYIRAGYALSGELKLVTVTTLKKSIAGHIITTKLHSVFCGVKKIYSFRSPP